jgi:hypothetical protein
MRCNHVVLPFELPEKVMARPVCFSEEQGGIGLWI